MTVWHLSAVYRTRGWPRVLERVLRGLAPGRELGGKGDGLLKTVVVVERIEVGFLARKQAVIRVEFYSPLQVPDRHLGFTPQGTRNRQHVLHVTAIRLLVGCGFKVAKRLVDRTSVERERCRVGMFLRCLRVG